MKRLNLDEYNVQELSCNEMTSTIGGGCGCRWKEFKEGFVEGF